MLTDAGAAVGDEPSIAAQCGLTAHAADFATDAQNVRLPMRADSLDNMAQYR